MYFFALFGGIPGPTVRQPNPTPTHASRHVLWKNAEIKRVLRVALSSCRKASCAASVLPFAPRCDRSQRNRFDLKFRLVRIRYETGTPFYSPALPAVSKWLHGAKAAAVTIAGALLAHSAWTRGISPPAVALQRLLLLVNKPATLSLKKRDGPF